ncbi:MAG: hemolysin family protein [Planctomycetota bacterium]
MVTLIVLLLALAALSAAAEHAIAEASRARIDDMVQGERRRRVDRLLEKHDELTIAAIIYRATFETGAIVALLWATIRAGTTVLAALGWALLLAVGVVEILPRLIIARSPERALLAMLPVLHVLTFPLRPLAGGLLRLSTLMRQASREAPEEEDEAADDILSAVAEGEKEGSIGGDQADMIENIVELRDCDVAEIMTPRPDMTFAALNDPLDDTIGVALESGHSRLPVYRETRDDVVGVLYVRDLIAALAPGSTRPPTVERLIRPASFVPETMRISSLLRHFQERETTMAVVVDEYGGTAGLVTISDITDLIVGEVRDHDEPSREPTVDVLSGHSLRADGRTPVRVLNDDFGTTIPESDEYDTVGGYLLHTLGRVPGPGERRTCDGTIIEVVGSDPRRVEAVKVTVQDGLRTD